MHCNAINDFNLKKNYFSNCLSNIKNNPCRHHLFFLANSEFIEARRRALKRFLNLIARHPAMQDDMIFTSFLTFKGSVSCSACFKKVSSEDVHKLCFL